MTSSCFVLVYDYPLDIHAQFTIAQSYNGMLALCMAPFRAMAIPELYTRVPGTLGRNVYLIDGPTYFCSLEDNPAANLQIEI